MATVLYGAVVRAMGYGNVGHMIDPTVFYATTFAISLIIGMFIKNVSGFMNTVHKKDRVRL